VDFSVTRVTATGATARQTGGKLVKLVGPGTLTMRARLLLQVSRAVVTFVCGAVSPTLLAASPALPSGWSDRAREFCSERPYVGADDAERPTPAEAVYSTCKASPDARTMAKLLARATGLPSQAAMALVVGTVEGEMRFARSLVAPTPEQVAVIESWLLAAFRKAPENRLVIDALVWLYSDHAFAVRPAGFPKALRQAMWAVPHSSGLAAKLSDPGMSELALDFLSLALSRNPADAQVLAALGGNETLPATARAACLERALALGPPNASVGTRPHLLKALIGLLDDLGLRDEVLAVYDAEDETTRRALTAWADPPWRVSPGRRLSSEPEETSWRIAVNLARAGRTGEARSWAVGCPELQHSVPDPQGGPVAVIQGVLEHALLCRWLGATVECDPFPFAVAVADELYLETEWSPGPTSGVELAGLWTVHEGLPELARAISWRLTSTLKNEVEFSEELRVDLGQTPGTGASRGTTESLWQGLVLPGDLLARVAVLEQEARGHLETLRAQLATPDQNADLGPEQRFVWGTLARLAGRTPVSGFVVRALPKGAPAYCCIDDEGRPKDQPTTGGPGLPPGFDLIRSGCDGATTVAVAVSQAYEGDRVALAEGDYWVLRSENDGVTWQPPLFTGLHVRAPYVITPGSAVPMATSQGLSLEVARRTRDIHIFGFPGGAPKGSIEKADGLLLELPRSALERDRDGDGLTDLAEERLLTDPDDPDTDHDGIPDGEDPLPQVARGVPRLDASGALAAMLSEVTKMASFEKQPSAWGLLEPGASIPQGWRSSPRVLYLQTDPSLLRGLQPPLRTIVIDDDNAGPAAQSRWPLIPLVLRGFFCDQALERCYARWTDGNDGGGILAVRNGATWTATITAFWIS
jgi:hypothetical protein